MTLLNELSAAQAAQKIKSGEITSEQLVRACIERIEAREQIGASLEFVKDFQHGSTSKNEEKLRLVTPPEPPRLRKDERSASWPVTGLKMMC